MLTRRIRIQLVIFAIVAVVALSFMAFGYVKLPAMFGIGRYTVFVDLPQAGGLYEYGNVTYRGTQVGKVESVGLSPDGHVRARLSLDSSVDIPSDVRAEVHTQTAIGEQFVQLLPLDGNSKPLGDGSVIALSNTSVPPPIDSLLDDTNRGLQAIPGDNLRTVIDESYTAFGGLGPELSRIVKGADNVATDARANLDALTTLIDQSAPVLNTQTDTADSVQAWAAHVASITDQLRKHDPALAGVIDNGGATADEARRLVERLQPTLPVILSNLVSVGRVAVTYQPALEQLLVLVPQGIANIQGGALGNLNTKQAYTGGYLDFDLNLNLPPPCTTGFLPAQQRRPAAMVDYPDRPKGDLYCRVPQDSPFNVRGARNLPCLTRPGKRAPSVKMCESDEQYVPLNDGYYWKGDPNATYSGQAVPQLPPGTPPAGPTPPAPASAPMSPTSAQAPPLAVAEYDPATGSYVGPDGKVYTQSDLAVTTPKEKTWEDMTLPTAAK
jgi:phospholipid/cholesterol/gamma-HCH transport system substrate-binding protein